MEHYCWEFHWLRFHNLDKLVTFKIQIREKPTVHFNSFYVFVPLEDFNIIFLPPE